MSLHVPLVVLQPVPAVKQFQPDGVTTNPQCHRWNQHARVTTYSEPASCVSLRRFRLVVFCFLWPGDPIIVHKLLALQLGADLGYLLHYYRASRGICLGDISSNEVGCLLQIEGEILQIGGILRCQRPLLGNTSGNLEVILRNTYGSEV